MNRRTFLRRAIPVSTIPFLMGGHTLQAFGRSPFLDGLAALAAATDRVLILIQLNGGNDGLNMVIPRDQYTALAAARSNIMIPEAKVLELTTATGLHPAMTGLQTLYKQGKVAVVQSVGYASPNFSHFRATDIWLTGSDSSQVINSGWVGRYLDSAYPGFPSGYPNTTTPDPLAIQIGSVVSSGLQGPSVSMGLAIANPNATYILPGASDTPPNTPAGHELTFVRAAASKGKNLSTLWPAAGTNSLADQMKIIAQLMAGGLRTGIYVVNLGGFDTHASPVVGGATDTGAHATLLSRISVAISAFMDDAQLGGFQDRVVGLTFSEFGRRIKSNASVGTDHGAAAPLFVFGSGVNGGVYGTNPVLPAAAGSNDNIAMQFDYRRVYAAVIKDWFGASATQLANILPGYQPLSLIKSSASTGVDDAEVPVAFELRQNYPNPFNGETRIGFAVPADGERMPVRLAVYDVTGREVAVLVDRVVGSGVHEVVFPASQLASGAYLYRLQAGGHTETRKMVLVR